MTPDDQTDSHPAPAEADTPAKEGGVSSQEPAEGADATPPPTEGSPKG